MPDIDAYRSDARNGGNVQYPQTKANRAYSGRDAVPIYISRGRFTSDAIKGMLAKPEDREEAVAKLFKSVGGRLIGWYLTFGHHDWMSVIVPCAICQHPHVIRARARVSLGVDNDMPWLADNPANFCYVGGLFEMVIGESRDYKLCGQKSAGISS